MYKNQIKASILLIVTLLLGLILGGLGSQYLIENRFEQMAKMRYPEGFVNVFEQIIDSKGTEADTVRVILREHHIKFMELNNQHLENIESMIDSMRNDLEPFLTEEQIEHISKRMEHRMSVGPFQMPNNREGKPIFKGKKGLGVLGKRGRK